MKYKYNPPLHCVDKYCSSNSSELGFLAKNCLNLSVFGYRIARSSTIATFSSLSSGGLIATAPHVVPVGAGMSPQEALHEVAHPVHGPQRVLAVGNALEQLRVVVLALQ